MKAKLIFAVLISAFLFNSCSSSDDSASIIGVWKYSREGAIVNGVEVLTPYDGNQDGCEKNKSEFTSDGILIDSYYTSTCERVDHPGTYTKSGNTIVTSFPESGNTFTFTILKLTPSLLKVKGEDGDILEFVK